MLVSWLSSSHDLLVCQGECVKKGLHRGLAEEPAALIRPPIIVVDQPGVEIGLQLVDRVIDLLVERDPVNSSSKVRWKRSQIPLSGMMIWAPWCPPLPRRSGLW